MNAKYIISGLLMSLSLSLSARTFLANDQIRVHTDQSFHDAQFQWDQDYAVLWFHMYGPSGSEWIKLNYVSPGLFVANMPQGKDYDHLILVRKDPNKPDASFDDGGVWNRTCRLTIPAHAGFNVLYKFWDGGDGNCDGSAEWRVYTPSINDIKATVSGVAQENIKVCQSAAGTQFMLHPKLRSDKTNYDYDNVVRHSWLYSADKNTWTSLDSYADNANKANGKERNEEFDRDFLTALPNPIPTGGIYYYLYSANPAGRRLIHITPDATDCELDCEITAFETAVSDVNADDNTYTLDGMVAFGKADGKLVIECDGKSITISDPKSPQAFSLHGVPAATEDGKTTTATAYFEGDQTNCSKTITIKVPNAKEEVEVANMDSLAGKQFVLTPKDYDPANTYVWLANGDTIKGAPQVLVIDPYGKDSTVTYTYKEYYPPTGSMEDLMENGSYEDATWDYSTEKVSDYDFWGLFPQTTTTQINFYTDTLPGGVNYPDKHKDNGFAIVRNANNFYPTYAKVEPKDGSNFALFDAKSGEEGANMKAWYATTANNSKLTLKKGTTYVLSFWAANINSYSEMDNAARFRFYIEDISGMTPVKLDSSELLDLSLPKYRNNLWHQCSKTYTAKADYNNIRISVVNLNNRSFNIGNDFALDDIQFHPISSVSKVVKTQQQFVVTAHEPKMDAFTATVVPLDCDAAPNYTIRMHVEYQNPQGRIIIKDDQSNTYSCVAPSVAFDTKAALDTNIVITGLTPAIHTWEAYFEEWPTAKISGVTTSAPVVPTIDTLSIAFSEPGCTDLTTTLTFDLAYTYQQGTLSYWVDDLTKQTAVYNIAKNTPDTLKALSFAGVPADGKNNHVLHISFDGAHSCVKDYTLPAVPFSPVIDAVTITGVPTTVPCGTTAYNAIITITPHYDATGKAIVLTYDSLGTSKTTAPIALTEFPYSLTLYNFAAGSNTTITAAFSTTPTCTTSGSYTLPKMTSCIRDSVTLCESLLPYFWPVGDQYYSGVVGENKYGVGTDSLFLFVVATPQISVGTTAVTCDDQSTIAIPFTVISGTPDSIDIAVGTNHYSGSISGSDIVFTRAAELEAGDYTATITVGTKGSTCTSQNTVDFSVALGNSMYSKWTDVLFIDNKAGLFVGYQWYENGVKMDGETAQRLYKPEGLPGTYCCQLLMRNGKKIYTCEQTFDKVQPSRSESTTPATIVRKYRVSPHVYIIQTETDGVVETKKILTAYE